MLRALFESNRPTHQILCLDNTVPQTDTSILVGRATPTFAKTNSQTMARNFKIHALSSKSSSYKNHLLRNETREYGALHGVKCLHGLVSKKT